MARRNSLRYIVTGPDIVEGEEPSYADPGPTLSRTITAASKASIDGTWYARDAVTNDVHGYTVREDEGKSIHTHRRGKDGK
jgi:hypothetical protein